MTRRFPLVCTATRQITSNPSAARGASVPVSNARAAEELDAGHEPLIEAKSRYAIGHQLTHKHRMTLAVKQLVEARDGEERP